MQNALVLVAEASVSFCSVYFCFVLFLIPFIDCCRLEPPVANAV